MSRVPKISSITRLSAAFSTLVRWTMIEFDARYSVEFAEETVYSYFKWKFHRLPVLEDNDFPCDRFDNERYERIYRWTKYVENAEREDTTRYTDRSDWQRNHGSEKRIEEKSVQGRSSLS